MKPKTILVSSAIVFKKPKDKYLWFLVRQNQDSGWEIPKTTVRRGESSVRAVIRVMGEQGGMRAKVLEEVGRNSGSASVNGKIVPQRYLYYLMIQRGESEVLGFAETEWMDYTKAFKRLKSKKDQQMLIKARDLIKVLQKTKKDFDKPEEFEEEVFDPS